MIRPVMENDAPELFDLFTESKDFLSKWMPWVETVESVESVKGLIQFYKSQPLFRQFVIVENLKIIGIVGLMGIDTINYAATINYALGKKHQGFGFATKACEELCRFAFDELKIERLVIQTNVGNEKSQNVAERLNFRLEGIMRNAEHLRGKFYDVALYSKLSKDK